MPALKRHALTGDPRTAAAVAGLRYSSPEEPGIARRRSGRGFSYRGPDGRLVRSEDTLARIRALAIPPAWRDVWICLDPRGHLQATGRDARGRKQYRYHPRWRVVRDEAKYYRLLEFCQALPRLRRRVESDLACTCLCREKVTAAVVSLLERAQLRIGNEEYARQNESYGATTLENHHARVRGTELELRFRGKGGAERRVRLRDRRLARMVRRCRELPGQRLFQFVGEDGAPAPITSGDVNDYLREATGGPFTAKDFRTWAATLACAVHLAARPCEGSERRRKREVNEAVAAVAAQLGNTPAVCRRSYIHPVVIERFMDGDLADDMGPAVRRLARSLGRADEGAALDAAMLAGVEKAVVATLARASRRGASRRNRTASRVLACAGAGRGR